MYFLFWDSFITVVNKGRSVYVHVFVYWIYRPGSNCNIDYFFTFIFNLDFASNNDNVPGWLQPAIYNELRLKYKNSFYVDQILEFHIGDVSEIGFKIACKENKYKYDYINYKYIK